MKVVRLALIVGVTLALTYLSFGAAVATITASTNPGIARTFDSKNPTALLVTADALTATSPSTATLTKIGSLAKAALRSHALSPRALRLLAVANASDVNVPAQLALLDLSQKMSRRDFGTQILLIEAGSQSDDIVKTLRHYDIALTTEAKVKETLFPILSAAIEDSAIRKAFAPYLLTDRGWVPEFVNYKYDVSLKSTALVEAALVTRGDPVFAEFDRYKQLLFDRAVRAGQIDLARQFYARFKISDPANLTSVGFAPATAGREDSLIRWQLFELPYIVPQFVRASPDSGFQLSVTASSAARGVVARKLVMLVPGRYQLTVRYKDITLVPGASAVWSMRCATGDDQPVFWQSDGRLSDDALQIDVPAGCGAQILDLAVSAAGEQRDSVFTVASLQLVPASSQPLTIRNKE
jgi:hypothetical protein